MRLGKTLQTLSEMNALQHNNCGLKMTIGVNPFAGLSNSLVKPDTN